MRTVIFDFDNIHSLRSFYNGCKKNLQLPGHFGNNLDALWDSITGGMELPVAIQFIHLTPYHLEKFKKQIALFRDAEKELDGELSFEYHTTGEKDAG